MTEQLPKVSPEKDAKTGRFLAGNSGNGGRKHGSRNKLGQDFLQRLYEGFQTHGAAAIEKVATRQPDIFLRICAGVLPKEVISMALSVSATASFAELDDAKAFLAAYRLCQSDPVEDVLEGELASDGWKYADID